MSRAVLISVLGFAAAVAALGLTWSLDSEGERVAETPTPLAARSEPERAAATTAGPAFDVVRVGEKGDTVVAGRAPVRSEVVLRDGGAELGRAQADERGEWVLLPTLPLAPGPHSLSLEARTAEGAVLPSADTVIVVVPDGGAQPPLAVVPQAAAGGDARLVLGPGGAAGEVSVDLVDRDPAGALFMGGRAPAGGWLHLYLDNRFLGRVQADGEGGWRLAVREGATHGLVRADLVDDRARVRARIEVPLAPPAAQVAAGPESVVVEPGASLWTIARRATGDGAAYTVIYGANRDRIRDPDRIYPGQVLQVPKN